jgi:tetratricopeptide (TPR) repeat protein
MARGDQREVLEPLVMQVLIALAWARGEILSRDDLIEICWGGRAVTDDALNRVLSRLRALARTFGTFQIETVTKVGYRLVGDTNFHFPGPDDGMRRGLVLGGAAAAGAAALGIAWWKVSEPPSVPPQAQLMIQKGMEALQRNDSLDMEDPGATLDAVTLLTDATRAAPQSATAWGALAMAYAVRKRSAALAERPGLAARCRAAAKRSLHLDPNEARALGALRLLEPVYRHWIEAERKDRAIIPQDPHTPILLFILSDMLGNVGRWREAALYSKRLDRTKFLIPGADRKLLIDLWASGELEAADQFLDVAVRQWPQQPQVWRTRLAYLMYSGRPDEALAIVRNAADRPAEISLALAETMQATAEALAGQQPAADAIRRGLDYLRRNPSWALRIAQACVALGDKAAAFAKLGGYYFKEGEWRGVAPQGGDEDRVTNALFLPMMKSAWTDPRFATLLRRIGLERYWKQTNTEPDFRRFA